MKLIHIYLLRSMMPYLLSALALFSLVIFMNQFVRVFNTAVMLGISAVWVMESLLNLLPMVLSLSLPMSFQLAMLLTLGSVSEKGELIALRSAGFSIMQIAAPFLGTAVFICLVMFAVNNWLSPYGFTRFQQTKNDLTRQISKLALEPKTFITIGEWSLHAEEVDEETGALTTVHLFRYFGDKNNGESFRISAPSGIYKVAKGKGVTLTLNNGELQRLEDDTTRKLNYAKFEEYKVVIPFNVSAGDDRNVGLSERTTPWIIKAIKKDKTLPKEERLAPVRLAEYKMRVSTRLADSLSPIVFFLLSCSFGFVLTKHNKAGGILMSIVILFGYYGLSTLGTALGKKVLWLAWFSPWLGLVAGLISGVILWRIRLKG